MNVVEKPLKERRRFAGPKDTEGNRVETFEGQCAQGFVRFGLGDRDGEADAVASGDVALDELHGADFDAGEPIHFEAREAFLEIFVNAFVCWNADERLTDTVLFPQLIGRFDRTVGRHKQDQRQIEKRKRLNPGAGLAIEESDGKVDFLFLDP